MPSVLTHRIPACLATRSDGVRTALRSRVVLRAQGHIHAYERTLPLLAGQPHPCGITHLTLGDGGNREGAALPWTDPQPAWSAFREGTFGVGGLTIINATHARYEWRRTACEARNATYHVDLGQECVAHHVGPWGETTSRRRRTSTTKDGKDGKDSKDSKDSKADDEIVEHGGHPKPPTDPVWIVRNAERNPRKAGCPATPDSSDADPLRAHINEAVHVPALTKPRAPRAANPAGAAATAGGATSGAEEKAGATATAGGKMADAATVMGATSLVSRLVHDWRDETHLDAQQPRAADNREDWTLWAVPLVLALLLAALALTCVVTRGATSRRHAGLGAAVEWRWQWSRAVEAERAADVEYVAFQ